MDIRGFTLTEISEKQKHYITCYFANSQLMEFDDGMFQESVLLYQDEFWHLIPLEHRDRFNVDDTLYAASGFIRFVSKGHQFKGKEYTVMLLYTETEALFLYLQEQNNITHAHQDILLVDFLK